MRDSTKVAVAAIFVPLFMTVSEHSLAGGEWPDSPYKEWFQKLERPDNHLHPERKLDPKSLSCCGAADVVKTQFKVESAGGRYPDDIWYAWLNESWSRIPADKIITDYAPDGQPYLFMLAGTVQCFVRPKGGL